jgi:hypothetical protein
MNYKILCCVFHNTCSIVKCVQSRTCEVNYDVSVLTLAIISLHENFFSDDNKRPCKRTVAGVGITATGHVDHFSIRQFFLYYI